MDILYLETEASKLRIHLLKNPSQRNKLFLIYFFFNTLLNETDRNVTESYILEFIGNYSELLSSVNISGAKPDIIENLIKQAKKISDDFMNAEYKVNLMTSIETLTNKFNDLISILNGNETDVMAEGISLPLLEKGVRAAEDDYGILGTLSVQIKPNKTENKFHVIPSNQELNAIVKNQINYALINAIRIASEYTKLKYEFWEVYIDFEIKSGEYSGNSFGMLLVLKLVEEFLRLYDAPIKVLSNSYIVLTGAVNNSGIVSSLTKEIISQKIKIVFYSGMKIFVLPDDDLTEAKNTLHSLNKIYPQRHVKLIGVQTIDDLFNLRNVVEIKKESRIIRTGKFIRKQALSISLIFLLAIVIFFSGIWNYDENPQLLTADGTTLFIKNQNDKILWTKNITVDEKDLIRYARIIDIDGDGINEVILTYEGDKKNGNPIDNSKVSCYNKDAQTIWEYSFRDKEYSKREVLNTEYHINIIDTLTFANEKSLFFISSNGPSFSSAIYRIDLRTGKRLPGTFWASGHIIDCKIKDINNDNQPEMIGVGYDNGYEDAVFFVYEVDTLTKVRPTKEEYLIKNHPISLMKSYIRFPKTDYDIYCRVRTPAIMNAQLTDDFKNSSYNFGVSNPTAGNEPELQYRNNYNYKDIDIVIQSSFRVQRDTLVAHGILKQPYTDTEEYKNLLRSNILYWKDGKWVKRKDLE